MSHVTGHLHILSWPAPTYASAQTGITRGLLEHSQPAHFSRSPENREGIAVRLGLSSTSGEITDVAPPVKEGCELKLAPPSPANFRKSAWDPARTCGLPCCITFWPGH